MMKPGPNDHVLRALDESINAAYKLEPSAGAYAERHAAAFRTPRTKTESGIVDVLCGLAQIADNNANHNGSGIGEDGILGNYWYDCLQGLMRLRDGDVGRFDSGLLGGAGAAMCAAAGFKGIKEPSANQDEQ